MFNTKTRPKKKVSQIKEKMGACCTKSVGNNSEKSSCFDCCCGGTREKSKFQSLTVEQTYFVLLWNQTSIDTLIFIQAIFFAVWQMLSLIPGFALYNGTAGPANAVTHFGWWSLIEFLVILVGFRSTMFQLSVPGNVNKLEFPARQAAEYNNFYLFVLLIGLISNAVQFGLIINELAYGSGQLASEYLGFGIYFCCQIGVVAFFLYPWIAFRVWVYVQHLKLAVGNKVLVFDATPTTPMVIPKEETTPQEETAPEAEETTLTKTEEFETKEPNSSVTSTTATNSQIRRPINGVITPMMAKVLGDRKNK